MCTPTCNKDILNPGTHQYVISHGRWNLVDVIRLRILRWEICPGLLQQARHNHKNPQKRAARGSKSGKERVIMEAEVGVVCMDDEGRDQQAKKCGWSLRHQKRKDHQFSPNPPERTQPCQHLDYSLKDSFQTSNLQNVRQ